MEEKLIRIKEWIERYPIAAFFILATIIMYGLLFPAIYMIQGDNITGQITRYYFSRIAVYSPAISGVILARFLSVEKERLFSGNRFQMMIPFWIIALIIQLADLKLNAPPEASFIGLVIFAIPVSFLPAWILFMALTGSKGIKDLLSSLIIPRGKAAYYLIALLTFPFVQVAGSFITNILNGKAGFPEIGQLSGSFYIILITFLSVFFYSGGINEEAGWRGFAQKRLQSRHSPIVTVLVLWVLLIIWHVPNDIIQYQNGGYIAVRIMAFPLITVLFSWIFNRTGGSILPVALFHASMNSMNPLMGIFPITPAGNIILLSFAVIVVFTDRMWRKLPVSHPAVHQDIISQSNENLPEL
jgi:membrane protease YdiL (CAAX protease family)